MPMEFRFDAAQHSKNLFDLTIKILVLEAGNISGGAGPAARFGVAPFALVTPFLHDRFAKARVVRACQTAAFQGFESATGGISSQGPRRFLSDIRRRVDRISCAAWVFIHFL